MRYYDFLNPSVNFMGPGCVKELGHRCRLLNMKKPLIVTDDFLAKVENGPVAQCLEVLKEAGIDSVIFTGLSLTRKLKTAMTALKFTRTTAVTPLSP